MKDPPVVLVTGGDSGIGLTIAGKFTEEGYRVAIRGLDRRAGTRALASLASSKHEAAYFVADIRKEKQIEKLMRQTVQRFGGLDVLCNNAVIQKLASIEEGSASLWDDVMSVNLRGIFLCTKQALPHLKKFRGTIINIASIGGVYVIDGGITGRPRLA